jgi:hypothetical protein
MYSELDNKLRTLSSRGRMEHTSELYKRSLLSTLCSTHKLTQTLINQKPLENEVCVQAHLSLKKNAARLNDAVVLFLFKKQKPNDACLVELCSGSDGPGGSDIVVVSIIVPE